MPSNPAPAPHPTPSAAALDGAVRNLAGNVLNEAQIVEFGDNLAKRAYDSGVAAATWGTGSSQYRHCESQESAVRERLALAIRANVRPRP